MRRKCKHRDWTYHDDVEHRCVIPHYLIIICWDCGERYEEAGTYI